MTSSRLAPLVAILLSLAACGPSLHTQPNPLACADSSWRSDNLLRALNDVVRGADSSTRATRARYQVDSGARVVLVRDPAICAQGAAAYSRMAGDTGSLARQRRVLVVRIGDKYAVDDPFTPVRAGEFEIWAIFDRKWRFVVGLTG